MSRFLLEMLHFQFDLDVFYRDVNSIRLINRISIGAEEFNDKWPSVGHKKLYELVIARSLLAISQ